MVLADLGRKLNAALSSLNRAPVVDDKVLALLPEVRFKFSSTTLGSRCIAQGGLRGSLGIRCERQTCRTTSTKGQDKSQGCIRRRRG